MQMTDCNGNPLPIFSKAKVTKCESVKSASPEGSVWLLELKVSSRGGALAGVGVFANGDGLASAKNSAKAAPIPRAGQFFMLRAEKSGTMLARPISVFHVQSANEDAFASSVASDSRETFGDGAAAVQFLILRKGQGTRELCSLHDGDTVQMLGPLGNGFEAFARDDALASVDVFARGKASAIADSSASGAAQRAAPSKQNICAANKVSANGSPCVCLVGGGIGVAPVAGFAETLVPESYDFFASFKSGSYGLDYIKPATLTITTDDGSAGVHGMLPSALTADTLRQRKYTAVYACGPAPMLTFVKKICAEADVKCYISMESRMACGMGACLGCTIATTEGYKRCCKDGPVFDASILQFDDGKRDVRVKPEYDTGGNAVSASTDLDLSVSIAGVRFENPVIAASGTFGYGSEYASVFDVNKLGGIASKGLTLEARQGNSGIRIWETPSGIINSIGLQNPGISHFIENELPQMLSLKPVTLVNLSGSTLETYVEGARLLEATAAPVIELNISCPNVLDGGAIWGCDSEKAAAVVSAVRAATKKPLIVKLTPQAPDLSAVVVSCIEAGADAISLCNTFSAVAIDIERGVPVFDNVKAGLSGPAIRPMAVRVVYDTVATINKLPSSQQVPVIAIGGIATWQDAVEFIMAGATAIEVGAATFVNPLAMCEIIDGLRKFMQRKGYSTISEMRGIAQR